MKSANLQSLSHIAADILTKFPDKRIFALYGEMGAGKTTLIKEFAKLLHVTCLTSSPTFAIVNEYPCDHDNLIYHFDFYRINNIDEAVKIGFEDYLYSGYYCFIEWPEMVESLLPEDVVKIRIEMDGDDSRIFFY